MRPFAVVILAAGKGTRMNSDVPKALQTICGRPMLGCLLDTVKTLRPKKVLVVAGHGIEKVREYFAGEAVIVHQKKRLGSGHAVDQAAGPLAGFKGPVMVLYCDTPLISVATLQRLLETHDEKKTSCALLSVRVDNPSGYGRVKRSAAGRVEGIVEENDCSETDRMIREINVGCYVFDPKRLFTALGSVERNPKKKEYYLTDVVGILAKDGAVEALLTDDPGETMGVNTRKDLSVVQEKLQQKILDGWIEKGVEIRDPRSTVIDAGVVIGENTVIYPHTVIEEASRIGEGCRIGPFARIRGHSVIKNGAVIGNFVEVVRSTVGEKSQVKHLSYLGDARVGREVNIGAGTITANFDGQKKHPTIIKDKAQIGSGTVLIAPVTVGRSARTGAGAVVTKGTVIKDRAVLVGVPAKDIKSGRA